MYLPDFQIFATLSIDRWLLTSGLEMIIKKTSTLKLTYLIIETSFIPLPSNHF